MVDHAIELKRAARRDVPYDRVWCVFDREWRPEHRSFRAAIDKASAHELDLAVSVPCFEFWYLLHAVYSTGPRDTSLGLKDEAAKALTGYDTADDIYGLLRPQRDTALDRAARVRAHHTAVSDERHPNPMTDVDRLVRFLIDLGA